MGLIKNEWLKLLQNKKFYALLLFLLLLYLLPVLMTVLVRINTYNGQVYPLTVFGVAASFALPLFLIVFVAEIITDEYLSGTLSLTLLHPVTRRQVLTAKVIFIYSVILLLLVFCLGLGYLIGTVIFGWGTDFMARGLTYSVSEGIFITVTAYLSASLPLLAFSLLVLFLALLLQSGAAVVGMSAGLLFLLTILQLLAEELSPVLINTYFNTLPIVLDYLNNPGGLTFRLLFVFCFALLFYCLALFVFTRRDMVY